MQSKKLILTEKISIFYYIWVILITIIAVNQINDYLNYIFIYIFFIVLVFLFKYLHEKYPDNKLAIFLRFCSPLLTLHVSYNYIEKYVTVFYGKFLDGLVIKFQELIFGDQPVLMLEKIMHPIITEIMKFSYISYLGYVFLLVLTLYFTGRYKEMKYSVFIILLTYYVCYIGFVLFPVNGPRFNLKFHVPIQGYYITSLQEWIMVRGQSIGACMPSSHLAVAAGMLVGYICYQIGKKIYNSN
jgi:hypothetical protein